MRERADVRPLALGHAREPFELGNALRGGKGADLLALDRHRLAVLVAQAADDRERLRRPDALGEQEPRAGLERRGERRGPPARTAIAHPGHDTVARGDRGEAGRVDVEREHPLDLAARRPRVGGAERVDRHRAVGVLDARTAREAGPVRHERDVEVTGVGHDRVACGPEPGEEPPGLLERERPARLDHEACHP